MSSRDQGLQKIIDKFLSPCVNTWGVLLDLDSGGERIVSQESLEGPLNLFHPMSSSCLPGNLASIALPVSRAWNTWKGSCGFPANLLELETVGMKRRHKRKSLDI